MSDTLGSELLIKLKILWYTHRDPDNDKSLDITGAPAKRQNGIASSVCTLGFGQRTKINDE